MSACQDKLLLLHGLVDDELDAANSLAIEAHLKSCPGCSEELARIEAVRTTLAGASLGHRAPDALRNRIDQQLAEAAPRARPLASQRPPEVAPSRWQPAGGAAAIAGRARPGASERLLLGSLRPRNARRLPRSRARSVPLMHRSTYLPGPRVTNPEPRLWRRW